jgi:hypothetical protein
MAFMLSMADVEKARSIAERYSFSCFVCCPLVFKRRCWPHPLYAIPLKLVGGTSTQDPPLPQVEPGPPPFQVVSC